MKGKNVGAIKKLQEEIEYYDMNIKDDESDANSYYQKGVTIGKISKLSEEDGNSDFNSLQQQALECLNKAIENDSSKSLYYIERSKIYTELGDMTSAVKDMTQAQAAGIPTGIEGRHIQNTMKAIIKIDAIQQGIKALTAKGEISDEFAKHFTDLAGITAENSAQIAQQGLQIEDLYKIMSKMDSRLTTVEDSSTSMQSQITDNTSRITAIEEEMTKFVSKAEFESYAVKAEDRLSIFDDKIQFIEVEVEGQKKTIAHIDDSLQRANIFAEVEVKAELDALKHEPAVHEYASKFYWTLSNYLLAYRVLSTGMVEGSAFKGKSGIIEKLFGFIPQKSAKLGLFEPLNTDKSNILHYLAYNSSDDDFVRVLTTIIDLFKKTEFKTREGLSDDVLGNILNSVIINSQKIQKLAYFK